MLQSFFENKKDKENRFIFIYFQSSRRLLIVTIFHLTRECSQNVPIQRDNGFEKIGQSNTKLLDSYQCIYRLCI